MVKLRALIFGTVRHQYWGYLQGRNYASVNNILKVMDFFKNSHFALFSSFDIYAKDTKFINGTSYRHMHTETDTDRYRYSLYILHFLAHLAYMPKIQILYLAYHRLTHAQTFRHAHR